MAEAAITIFTASFSASLWALFCAFLCMLLFYCAIPMVAKWSSFGMMSVEAARRAATLRAIREPGVVDQPVMHWA